MKADKNFTSNKRKRNAFAIIFMSIAVFALVCSESVFVSMAQTSGLQPNRTVSSSVADAASGAGTDGVAGVASGARENGEVGAASGARENGEAGAVSGAGVDGEAAAGGGTNVEVGTASGAGTDGLADADEKLSASVKHKGKGAYIRWDAGDRVLSCNVYRANSKNGEFEEIASVVSGCSYTDKEVERGRHYYYRVAAVTEDGVFLNSGTLKFGLPLKKVTSVKLKECTDSSFQVSWKKSQGARYYRVYYAKKKSGNYHCAGITRKTELKVKKLESDTKYYVYVKACASKKGSELDSGSSKIVSARTKKKIPENRLTIFAGDSITTGLTAYGVLDQISIGGRKEVVADIGLNTTTFRTRRVFSGRSGMEQIIAHKPFRVYMMLGMNEIHYRSAVSVIAGYREIVKGIQAGSPDTDIVLLAVSPVTNYKRQVNRGFAQIPEFNRQLKALAESMGVGYHDYTSILKDASGWLNSRYAAGDGIHWTASAYRLFASHMTQYDKSRNDAAQ